jgi:hypothetical protein
MVSALWHRKADEATKIMAPAQPSNHLSFTTLSAISFLLFLLLEYRWQLIAARLELTLLCYLACIAAGQLGPQLAFCEHSGSQQCASLPSVRLPNYTLCANRGPTSHARSSATIYYAQA